MAGIGWGEHRIHGSPRKIIARHYKGNDNDHFRLLQYCMARALRSAEQASQRRKATQIKSGRCTFAMVKEEVEDARQPLKTSPELANLLRQQHSDVRRVGT